MQDGWSVYDFEQEYGRQGVWRRVAPARARIQFKSLPMLCCARLINQLTFLRGAFKIPSMLKKVTVLFA